MSGHRLALALLATMAAQTGCSHLGGPAEFERLLAQQSSQPISDERRCLQCHPKIRAFLATSIHRQSPGCENCHGPGGDHGRDPPGHLLGPRDLTALSPLGRSEMCLRCHKASAATWPSSDHSRAGLTCADCHTDAVHFKQGEGIRPPSLFPNRAQFCEQCHGAVMAELRQPFHHPVPEGEITCGGCHSVHGQVRPAGLLEGAEPCARCHPRQTQAKVFRHAALDEGCGICHSPHGSPIAGMLRQQGNGLCLQCHFEPGFPVIAGVQHSQLLAKGALCYDCHVEVHGSNSDPSLLGRVR